MERGKLHAASFGTMAYFALAMISFTFQGRSLCRLGCYICSNVVFTSFQLVRGKVAL